MSSPIKANLHYSLSRSGILSLDKADAVIEYSEWVKVPKKNLTVENNSTSASPNASPEANGNSTVEGSSDTAEVDDEKKKTNSTNNSEEKADEDLGTENKLKKRTFRVPLKVKCWIVN